jgi:FtsP/CotA-like multicopper oxidase with cupredoxin domain
MGMISKRVAVIVALASAIAAGATGLRVLAQDVPRAQDVAARPGLAEPVTLASKDGVLEVTLTAHQGTARLDTVATPVKNMLIFAYAVKQGTASNGRMSDDNLYPAPTLQVYPGETLIVHMNDALTGLTIRDYYDPAYTAKGARIPIYPAQLTSSPVNLHVHGLHVSPKGNADNVLVDIQAGMSNTYTYHVPADMPQGAYWYHSHLHTLTTAQTYLGLAGILAIGRVDGNLPAVTRNHIPIRNMVLQYNIVFDRAGGLAQINFPHWPEFLNTETPPTGNQLAEGTYEPSLAPVNFADAKKGTQYFTSWYAGKLSIENMRGRFAYMPSNLQRFTPASGSTAQAIPANPSLPDRERDVQFTVNGQFEPVVKSKAGQTEIWVLENISDIAYMQVELTETATGRHPKIAIVGQDGNPYPAVHYPPFANGTKIVIAPASRYAIAVTMPAKGDLVLSLPPIVGNAKPFTTPGILYTSNGTPHPPASLGTITVSPSAASYYDGFFPFPAQELVRATTSGGQGKTTAFVAGQKLGAFTSFVDVSRVKPDVTRKLLINGGFLNDKANNQDPKAFTYAFDGKAFPNVPLIQPRLNSVEEWDFVNHNNDAHPIHIHVNDFQVTHTHDPNSGLTTGIDMWGEDNVNVPAPKLGPNESVIDAGTLSLRTKFQEFTGVYVIHCHRLNHEDNGLMALVSVIPEISAYAVVIPGTPGRPTAVRIYDGNGDRLITTVTPFPDFYGVPSVAMGETQGNGILDLIVGTGKGHKPEVVVYSGKNDYRTTVARFAPFSARELGGISVAAAQIDGTAADNIIVGSGAGAGDRIKVYGSKMPALGKPPALFTQFAPFGNDNSGVSVAAGMVDVMSGRYSIVAAPGPGSRTVVKVFRFWLLKPIPGFPDQVDAEHVHQDSQGPVTTATFAPFGNDYRGGVSLGIGWVAGAYGGAQSIVVGQRQGGSVAVYSSANGLQGAPAIYLKDPQQHDYAVGFSAIARFHPFGSNNGVEVGTTATTTGADLLVSGVGGAKQVQVAKYAMVRPNAKATTLSAKRIGLVSSSAGSQAEPLAGN